MVIPNNTPDNYTFLLSQVEPTKLNGGTIKVVDSRTFKVSTTIAVAEITVEVGGMRYVPNSPSGDICETNQCQSATESFTYVFLFGKFKALLNKVKYSVAPYPG